MIHVAEAETVFSVAKFRTAQKLAGYKTLGKRINKTESYRDGVGNRIDVRDYITDPFGGRSINPLVKLIKLSGEIRRSAKKYKLFKLIVGKQFPHFSEIRWHIKFYIY